MKRREFVAASGAFLATAACQNITSAQTTNAKIASRPIPSTGEQLPIVGYGQSPSFRQNDVENSAKLLDVIRELGGKFIDTGESAQSLLAAYMYDNDAQNDFLLGTNLRSQNSETDIAKVLAAKKIQARSKLDLALLSRPSNVDESWARLQRLKEEGHARYVGVTGTGSDFTDYSTRLLRKYTPDFIQINYSMLEPEIENDIVPMAQDKGIALLTNRPFVNGQYFSLVNGKKLPEWVAEFDCHSWAQFSIKWILGNGAVNCVVAETTKAHHALDNLSAGIGRLPDAAMRRRMRAHVLAL